MKTHWRNLVDNEYLGSWDFDDNEVKTFTIKSVEAKKVANIQGSPTKFIVKFVEDKRPMIANVTNMKTIGKVIGTDDYTKWAGNAISLRVEKVEAFREVTDAIRVVREKPAPIKKPIKPEDWDKALKAIEKGQVKADDLLNTRELTAEQKATLEKIISDGQSESK
jgi:hypothetical protein